MPKDPTERHVPRHDAVTGSRTDDTRVFVPALNREIEDLVRTVLPPQDARLARQKLLAKGGMGRIEAVLDVALQRRIAKKIIDPALQSVRRAVAMFLREAQITAQLDHPAIVPVHEVGMDENDRLFFTMKLVEGETLTEWIDRLPESPLEPHQLHDLLDIALKVCDAVAFAHSRGVVHGDIKPDNVMVGAFGAVYLMDWGLAYLEDDAATRTSRALRQDGAEPAGGTAAYMSPEQARRQRVDRRSDVFLLGALLYRALAHRPPYGGDTLAEVLSRASAAEFEPLNPTSGPRVVSSELERIVARAMAREPESRFASVSELRDELKRFLMGEAGFPRLEVSAGQHVVREGEQGDEAYILVSGRVQVYRTVDGRREVLREMAPGEVFGEMAILTSPTRTASVVATQDCVLRVVTGEILDREVHGMKPWMASLTRALAQRLREREGETE